MLPKQLPSISPVNLDWLCATSPAVAALWGRLAGDDSATSITSSSGRAALLEKVLLSGWDKEEENASGKGGNEGKSGDVATFAWDSYREEDEEDEGESGGIARFVPKLGSTEEEDEEDEGEGGIVVPASESFCGEKEDEEGEKEDEEGEGKDK